MSAESWDPRRAPPPAVEGARRCEIGVYVSPPRLSTQFNERKGHVYLGLTVFGGDARSEDAAGEVLWRRVFSWMRRGRTGWDCFSNDGAHRMPPRYGLPRRGHTARRRWAIDPAQLLAVCERAGALIDSRRYHALRFNCIHFAWTLLATAGVDPNLGASAASPAPPPAGDRGLGDAPPLWPRTIPRLIRRWHLAAHERRPIPANV